MRPDKSGCIAPPASAINSQALLTQPRSQLCSVSGAGPGALCQHWPPRPTWDQNLHVHSLGIRVHPTVRARTALQPGPLPWQPGSVLRPKGSRAQGVPGLRCGGVGLHRESVLPLLAVAQHGAQGVQVSHHQVLSQWPEGVALAFCQLWLQGSAQAPVHHGVLEEQSLI